MACNASDSAPGLANSAIQPPPGQYAYNAPRTPVQRDNSKANDARRPPSPYADALMHGVAMNATNGQGNVTASHQHIPDARGAAETLISLHGATQPAGDEDGEDWQVVEYNGRSLREYPAPSVSITS